MYIIWSWKTISIDSGVARHDMLVLCDMIFVNWYCRILHQIPAVNLFMFNYIMMLNVRSVCSVWSNIPKKTPKNKTQHQERSTHKGIIYIYMLIYLDTIHYTKLLTQKKSSLSESPKKEGADMWSLGVVLYVLLARGLRRGWVGASHSPNCPKKSGCGKL